MEKNDYNFYDSVDNTATRWLAWNLQDKGKIGFSCVNCFSEEHLWLMNIARHLYVYSEQNIYMKTNLFDYLWLKYIKRFKFLKYYKKRKNKDVFLIDATKFIEEVAKTCNTNVKSIKKIYNTYYRR